MQAIINVTPKLFPKDKVEAIAADMQANDEDWTYKVNHDPTGRSPYARIEIYDEDVFHLGPVGA